MDITVGLNNMWYFVNILYTHWYFLDPEKKELPNVTFHWLRQL